MSINSGESNKVACKGKEKAVTNKDTDIAPQGDVIPFIGNQGTRLRIHSLFLRFASPVFAAMFGPYFDEGQDLESTATKEVAMSEDDARAVLIVCVILHHHTDRLPKNLASETVFQVAKTADKYDCLKALHFASQELLSRGCAGARPSAYMMAAAYLFKDSTGYEYYARQLLECHDSPFSEIIKGDMEIVPPTYFTSRFPKSLMCKIIKPDSKRQAFWRRKGIESACQ